MKRAPKELRSTINNAYKQQLNVYADDNNWRRRRIFWHRFGELVKLQGSIIGATFPDNSVLLVHILRNCVEETQYLFLATLIITGVIKSVGVGVCWLKRKI